MTLSPDDLQARAQARVARKIGLLVHVTVFVLVNLGLALLAQQHDAHWHVWPLMGWGVGLFFHAMGTWLSLSGDGWRQGLVEAEVAKLRGRG